MVSCSVEESIIYVLEFVSHATNRDTDKLCEYAGCDLRELREDNIILMGLRLIASQRMDGAR